VGSHDVRLRRGILVARQVVGNAAVCLEVRSLPLGRRNRGAAQADAEVAIDSVEADHWLNGCALHRRNFGLCTLAYTGMSGLSDVELLGVEMELLWDSDHGPDLVVACARDGVRARIARWLPPAFAQSVVAALESVQPSIDFSVTPPVVDRLRVRLEEAMGAGVRLTRESGPSFLIEEEVRVPTPTETVNSASTDVHVLEGANPGNWRPDEWRDLLAGRLGAWVMAVVDRRVVSICHTPVANDRAAEAGTWTRPDFRGRGLAAACTAEWARLLRPSGRLLFYSTSRSNRSSQRVAGRLGLRQLGCLWQLRRA